MTTYYPELGEKRPAALIHTHHVINSTFGASWALKDDADARETFRRLNIRPRNIEVCHLIDGGKKWSALITQAAASKLRRLGSVAHQQLLD